MKNYSILIIIAFSLLSPGLSLAEEIPLTLDEAVVIALRDNRNVLLKAEDIKKAKAKIRESNAALFPEVDITAAYQNSIQYYPEIIGKKTGQVSVKQYLYKGGKTMNTINQNKYNLTVSEALLEKARIETVLSVKKAFYALLLAREFENINKGIVENTKQHLDFIKARYKSGQSAESEVLTVEASLKNSEQAYKASASQAESGAILLNNLLYLDKDTKIAPSGSFDYEPAEMAYDEAFLKAMRSRPEIKQYEAQANADKKAVEIAKADGRPNVYASWDYYASSHLTANNKNWNDYHMLGVTFSWPIFDGWATKAKVEQAMVDLKTTQLTKEKAVADIALELKNSYLSLKDAIAKMQAVESDAKVYNDNLKVLTDKYKEGIASLLDLNDARLKYDISLFNKNQAIYDYVIAKGSFEKAMGG